METRTISCELAIAININHEIMRSVRFECTNCKTIAIAIKHFLVEIRVQNFNLRLASTRLTSPVEKHPYCITHTQSNIYTPKYTTTPTKGISTKEVSFDPSSFHS